MSEPVLSADTEEVLAVADLIRGRRTVNLYEPEKIPADVVLEAIEVARWAPNHKLTEPWHFYLLGPEMTRSVSECWADFEAETKGEAAGQARRKRLAAIPGHFVVTSARHSDEVLDQENYAATCCAVQNLMLYLWQRGVGCKWTSGAITREPGLYALLGIDQQSERIVGYFWYGKPSAVGEQKRKEVTEISTVLD